MRKILLVLSLAALATGCSKKDDTPAPQTPHVAGVWSGTGTDDAIGFYNITMTLTQSGNQASGTFATSSGFATTSGNVTLTVGPAGGNNVQKLALTRTQWSPTAPAPSRTCAGTMMLSTPTFMTASSITFSYTITDCQGGSWNGGANLTKTAGTN
jgi:hypothetical protein